MDHEKIPMPTEAEKRRAIARILDAGLPPRPSLGRELLKTLRAVGAPALFFGTWDCLALSLLIWALCLLPALFVASSTGSLAPALLLFYPLLYAALSLLTAWSAARQICCWGCSPDGRCPWAGCWPCLWPACFCTAPSPCCASGCRGLLGGWRRRSAGSCWAWCR